MRETVARISSRAFTARRIEMLRDSIQGHVDDLVAAMLEKPQPKRAGYPAEEQ